MLSEPVQTTKDKPLISVLIYNYEMRYIAECLDSIFNQDILDNVEVIISDDASNDGSWDIAVEYARKYHGIVTIARNKTRIGYIANERKCKRLSKGKYYVSLCDRMAFLPEYIERTVLLLESDARVNNSYVHRKLKSTDTDNYVLTKPLVTICIFNYNYGQYLRQCFDSVYAQTYDNIEICFSDNASNDDSWDIALEYIDRYPETMSITRNRKNFGPSINLDNCYVNMRGKYVLKLCSDDALMPEFVQHCVQALEANPDAGFAMVHRTIIDEKGRMTEEPPFYNQSCVIKGAEQAAVYMMSSINPSISQNMYNVKKMQGKRLVGYLNDRWYGDWIMDFNMCCEFPMVYIKEPLLLNRVHSQSDGFQICGNLLQCLGQYVLFHQFSDIASTQDNLSKVIDRLPQSIAKLGKLCIRYCVRLLYEGDERTALRYYHLSLAISPDVAADATAIKLSKYWDLKPADKLILLDILKGTDNLAYRNVSYEPPPGSTPLSVGTTVLELCVQQNRIYHQETAYV